MCLKKIIISVFFLFLNRRSRNDNFRFGLRVRGCSSQKSDGNIFVVFFSSGVDGLSRNGLSYQRLEDAVHSDWGASNPTSSYLLVCLCLGEVTV